MIPQLDISEKSHIWQKIISIKLPSINPARQSINSSTNYINIPFRKKKLLKIEKVFYFKQNRELYLVIMSFKKLPQTWPISFQYTLVVQNWTEVANICSVNFESWILWVSCHSFFLITFLFYNFDSRTKWRKGTTQISRAMEWMMKAILKWKQKLSIKELWQCEKNMYLHCVLMESMFEWH